MARIVWGLATSHVPSIGAAHDRGLQEDPDWKPLFDGYKPLQEWMADNTPDVAIVVYNDHANAVGFEIVPTFGIGVGDSFNVTDEGWGVRPVPTPVGKPEFARFLTKEIIDQGFDLPMFNQLEVDHGLTVPMSVYCPEPASSGPAPSSQSWLTCSSIRSRRPRAATSSARPSARPWRPTRRTLRSLSSAPVACLTSWLVPAQASSTKNSTATSWKRSRPTQMPSPSSPVRNSLSWLAPRASSSLCG